MKIWWMVAAPQVIITEDNVDLTGEMATFATPGGLGKYQEPKYQLLKPVDEDALKQYLAENAQMAGAYKIEYQ